MEETAPRPDPSAQEAPAAASREHAATQAAPTAPAAPSPESDEARRPARYAEAQRARAHRGTAPAPTRNPALHPARRDPTPKRPPLRPRRQSASVPAPDAPADNPPAPRRRAPRDRFVRRLIWISVVLALLVVLVLVISSQARRTIEAVKPALPAVALPETLDAFLPDEEMGYTALDFTNAILGESREKKDLVVMEQDVEVTSKISQNLLNISLFSKAKIIHSYGTGVYVVSLEELTEHDVSVDEATKIITVTIPHAALSYVNVDVNATTFEDTQRALLAVGEIKLTAEQKQKLDESVYAALDERLQDPALFTKADEIALNKVREVFAPIVSALSDAYIVKVVMRAEG